MRPPAGGCMHPPVPTGGYTSLMPTSAEEPPDAAPAEEPLERYGPLIVRRTVKEDGRALIRFDRADEPPRT
jgi:hypothetical protein